MRELAESDRGDADHRHVQGVHEARLFEPALSRRSNDEQHDQGRERHQGEAQKTAPNASGQAWLLIRGW
jgi:hypothetical protein